MKRHALFLSALPVAVLTLSACSDRDERDPQPSPNETMMPVEPDGGIGDGAGPPEPVTAETIPRAFLGAWDAGNGNCTTTSTTRVEVQPGAMQFYESHGDVTRVEVDSPERIVVSLAMEGEGEEWQMARVFTLSENGRTLTPSAVDPEDQFEPTPLKKCE